MKRIIGRIDPSDKNVHIWGAGFAGLILGYYLKGQGYKVSIYEKTDQTGGKIRTDKTPVGLVEKGANALYMNADSMDLLKEIQLEPVPVTKKLKRLIFTNGKPRKPMQLGILAKIALNGGKRPPLISDGLTVGEFFRPLIGDSLVKNFLSPILSGIYASSADQLHFKSVFYDAAQVPQYKTYRDFIKVMIKEFRNRPRLEVSGSVSFEGGMQTLINRLTELLKDDIKLGHKEDFRLRGNTVICTDALSAAELLRDLRPALSQELARIQYHELGSVTVFLKREIKALQKSFGVLIPLENGFNSIGVLNNKAAFPLNNQNTYSYTFITKSKVSEEHIHSDIKALYNDFVPEDIDSLEFYHSDRAIPSYNLQRFLSVKKLHLQTQDETKLAIFGNYVAGISLREMISAARKFATNPSVKLEDYERKI